MSARYRGDHTVERSDLLEGWQGNFGQLVQDALSHLHDLPYLQTHPLVRWIQPPPGSRSSTGGLLQQGLLGAIDSLRTPDHSVGVGVTARSHAVLSLRFADGLEISDVCTRLGISRSQFYREYRQGLAAIVSLLEERWRPIAVQSADRPTNLPLQLTSFVGREREIAEVKRLLKTTRLLTLTGTGGCGKTRLAYRVAEGLIRETPEEYLDGVWVVELASLSDPTFVAQSVAFALDVREVSGQPILETLLAYLKARRILLILDNCEHLVDASAQLVERLLLACPEFRVLATSREMLGANGEVAWQVPSLDTPDFGDLPALDRLAELEAVRLFVERARLVQPSFQITERNASAVAQIATRLDGIPLAIELAAARTRGLTVQQIAARLGDSIGLLTGGRRTALRRQQTVRATIDWSHELLAAPERVLFRRLAVFAGGWTLDAAEDVCSGEDIRSEEMLDLLSILVDKSLVLVDVTMGEARYRLLETIRQYAWEQLASAGEAEALRARHRCWYVALAERIEPELWGPNQAARDQALEAEHDNLRAALESCLEADIDAGQSLAWSIWRFWADRGYLTEGCRWLEAVLAADDRRTSLRAWCFYALGYLLATRGELRRARSLLEESTILQRELGDTRSLSWVLVDFGMVLEHLGDFAEAETHLEESLTLSRELGDARCIEHGLRRLASVVHGRGDLHRAGSLLDECLVVVRVTGNQRLADWTLSGLGALAQAEGDYARARCLLEEGLSLARTIDHSFGIIHALIRRGNLARVERDYEIARDRLDEALSLAQRIGSMLAPVETHASLGELARVCGDYVSAGAFFREGLAFCARHEHAFTSAYLGLLGMADLGRGDFSRGVRLIGASRAHGGFVGVRYLWDPGEDCDAILALARADLGGDHVETAWAEGQAMTLEQAVEYALKDES